MGVNWEDVAEADKVVRWLSVCTRSHMSRIQAWRRAGAYPAAERVVVKGSSRSLLRATQDDGHLRSMHQFDIHVRHNGT